MDLKMALYNLTSSLYYEIKEMTPEDVFSSPRDIDLVTEVNKKTAILNHLQDAMKVINPNFDITK